MVHMYKSYNTNPNLWIFSNDTDFHQMTEEEGEEGKMSISERRKMVIRNTEIFSKSHENAGAERRHTINRYSG